MAKTCDTGVSFQKDYLQIGSQGREQEIIMDIIEPLNSCLQFTTEGSIDSNAKSLIFDRNDRPDDKLTCSTDRCFHTGTLQMEVAAGETGAFTTFEETFNAEEIANGVKVFYIKVPAAGTYTVDTTIGDVSEGAALANANIYTVTVEADDEGFYPVVVDMSMLPAAVIGTGWTPSTDGVMESIEITNPDLVEDDVIGVSSVTFFDSIDDLKVTSRIFLSCVDEFSADDESDVVEEACNEVTADENSATTEITLSANRISGDLMQAHPNAEYDDETTTTTMALKELEVTEFTDADGNVYGAMAISEMVQQDCGVVSVVDPNACPGGLIMREISADNGVNIDENSFVVLADGTVLVNESLVGKNLAVYYTREVEAEQIVHVGDRFRDYRVRLTVRITYKNGKVEERVYDNVILKGFPWGYSASDSTTRELTFSVGKNVRGHRYTSKLFAAGVV